MMTISKAYLERVTGGAGGHGEDRTPIDGCLFKGIAEGGRKVDALFPSGQFSEAFRKQKFLAFRDAVTAECRQAKSAKR